MPITITPLPPLNKFGPGLLTTFQSSLIGPLAVGTKWNIVLSTGPEGTFAETIYQFQRDAFQVPFVQWVPRTSDLVHEQIGPQRPAPGTTVYMVAQLLSPSNAVLDSGTLSEQFDATTGLSEQTATLVGALPTSGFTSTDRTTIENGLTTITDGITSTIQTAAGAVQATLGQIFSRQGLDRLTLSELTSGPTSDPVRANIDGPWYGVIVRMTTIAPNLEPMTPDQDWYLADLAVLRVRRGIDLEFRRGIHTSSWMELSPWKYGNLILDIAELGIVPPECEVLVDFKVGCAGQVFLMAWP